MSNTTKLTFKQKLYKAIADAAALEHEMADFLFMEITHELDCQIQGLPRKEKHLRYTVTIAVRETESLFDVLIDKVAAFRHWLKLECGFGPWWRKRHDSGGPTVPAEDIKPYVDEHLRTLFRRRDPTLQTIRLQHNDPRFWDLFKEIKDENRIALKAPCRRRASV